MGISTMPAAALRERLSFVERPITVVDARDRDAYARGHLPGAIWLGWEEWVAPSPPLGGPILRQPGYWGELLSLAPEAWAACLAARGFCSASPVVVYADGPRSKGREGRIAWMLLYLGVQDVYLLDGGWRGWIAAGGVITTAIVEPAPGQFDAELREQRRARLPALRACYHAGDVPQFVDTRAPCEFEGEIHPYLPRMGHLPGAVNFTFSNLFDADERYVTPTAYLQGLPEAMRGARDLVTYCEVGIRASLVALIHEIATGQVVRVFDASLMAWGLEPELPVYKGSSDERSVPMPHTK